MPDRGTTACPRGATGARRGAPRKDVAPIRKRQAPKLPPYYIEALARGMTVIDLFLERPGAHTLAEISEHLDMSKATVYRILRTFKEVGYLRQDAQTKRFGLSMKALKLQSASVAALELPVVIEPYLRDLRERTGESCAAAILDGTQIRYIARIAPRRIVPIQFPQVGATMPAHATALGKALLSDQTDAEVRALYAGKRLERMTANTIRSVEGLIEGLHRIRRDGVALTDEEIELGVRSAAAAIRGAEGHVRAAVSISTDTAHTSFRRLRRELAPLIVEAAAAITADVRARVGPSGMAATRRVAGTRAGR